MKSLTKSELASLLEVARRHSESDYVALLVGFNHGLRVSEILGLTSENIVDGHLIVQRLKGSEKTIQALLPSEKELVEALAARGGKFFTICRKTLWMHMKAYAVEAGIPEFLAHPHVLKHTCGKLGLAGGMTLPQLQTYLGHKNGQNTMIYLKEDDAVASRAFAAAVGA